MTVRFCCTVSLHVPDGRERDARLRIIPTAAPDWAALQPDGRRRAVPRCWVSSHNGDIATKTGGLMSYAADYADTFRQAGVYAVSSRV